MEAKQVIFRYVDRAVKDAQQTGMGVHDGIARLHYGHIQWMMDTINKQEAQLRTLAEAVLDEHGDWGCQCDACKLAREVLNGK